MRLPILIVASLFILSGCAGKSDPPSEPPAGVTATGGDGLILVSWDMLSNLTYWIFYSQGGSPSVGQSGTLTIKNAISPRAVTGLVNDTSYSLLMNATENGSPAGPNSQTVVATPRLAGNIWTQGAVQGNRNLNALAFNGFGRYVTVGDGTTIFAGDFNYGHTDPVGVTVWSVPTTPPTTVLPAPPFATDFKAAIFNGGFVALGSNGSVATSLDGLTWTAQHAVSSTAVPSLTGLAWGIVQGNGTYFAVGAGGQIYTTNDLTQEWRLDTSNTTSDLTSVALLNNGFFATGANGTLLQNPGDGTGWKVLQTGVTTTLRAAAFMPNAPFVPGSGFIRYVAVGDAGTILTATDDSVGAVWTPVPPSAFTPAPPVQNLLAVTAGGATGTRFLAVGQGGTAVFGDSVISGVALTSIQWFVATQPQTEDLSSVHFFLGQYLAVGPAGGNAVSH